MPLLGAHVSIAGGVDRAPERGRQATCDVIQIFTKSNVRWEAGPITDSQRERFLANLRRFGLQWAFAHASYLINLASADAATRRRSRQALAVELARCAQLRLPYLVLHPGSHGGCAERQAIRRIADGVAEAGAKQEAARRELPMVLFETTAGQGNGIGGRFEQLAELMGRLEGKVPVGVCFDTCHVFAAGYDLRSPRAYHSTMAEFDRIIGLLRIKVVHLNDSRGEMGSRTDRHEHIGRGTIGLGGFRTLLNDSRLADRPMVIETPKGKNSDLDIANLRRLRALLNPARDGKKSGT